LHIVAVVLKIIYRGAKTRNDDNAFWDFEGTKIKISFAKNLKFEIVVFFHNRSKKSYLITNGCHCYVVMASQRAKKIKKICKNLYNFE